MNRPLEGKNFLINYRSTPHATTKVPPCELLFNRKIQGTLTELTTKKVINKHKEAKENIDKRKNTNKKYYDVKKRAKASNIKEEILSYVSRNQSTNYHQGSTQRNLQ